MTDSISWRPRRAARSQVPFTSVAPKWSLDVGPFSGFLGRRPLPKRGLFSMPGNPQITLGDRHPVAWVGTHRHGPDGEDEPYVFCYLFGYSLALPSDCREIGLPVAPELHIFAATLAGDALFGAVPAHPLYD